MKGHVYQRSKGGSWAIVYDLPPDSTTGKRRQKSEAVNGTKRDAERVLRERQTSLDKGMYVKPNKVTVGEWLATWLHDYVAINISARTLESYSSNVECHLIPALVYSL